MKKSLILVLVLLGLGATFFVVLHNSRSHHSFDGSEAETEATLHKTPFAKKGIGTQPTTSANPAQRVQLNLQVIQEAAENSEEPRDAGPAAAPARDPAYDQLLATGPRDAKREQEVLSKLRDAFSDRPGVSVAEVACNADFCRAEVLGSAEADVIQDAKTLMMAVAAKNLKCLNAKDETSTKMGCYFGAIGKTIDDLPQAAPSHIVR
jgi:hypothetical protein